MDKYIGKRLDGRYEIQELIGVGGMANVYKAIDVLEHKTYAVKILRDEFLGNEEFVRRFKNESKAIAVLSHPNIVKVYDVSFTDRVQFIVMEYVDGITLKDYIDSQHVIQWKEVVHFVIQVLRALQHAHDKGIVHRDIKPQNIMLLQDGTIKVMDFGIARFARSETRTMTDKALGSVHYISPEQARGEPTDAKTDIYSVGVMMFEMLTGQLPFVADSPVSVAIKQISAQAKRPREINTEIPEGLEEIVVRAMQKDVTKRYSSAAEMLKDIDEFKRNPSIQFQYKYFSDTPASYFEAPQEKAPSQTERPRRAAQQGKGKRRAASEAEYEDKSPLVPIMTGVALSFVITAVVFIIYIFILNNPFAKVPDIPMPKLVGLRYEDVINNPNYSSFKYNITQDYNNDYEEGYIFEQSPAADRMVKAQTTVNLSISLGSQVIKVPDVYNLDSLTAIAKIKAMNIGYEEQQISSETYAAGRVVKTDPPKGTEITADTKVIIYVSTGSKYDTNEIPPMVGLNIDDAKRLVDNYGFKVGDISPVSSNLPEGTIISHDPQEGVEAEKDTVINFQVSAGNGSSSSNRYNIRVPMPSGITELATVSAYVGDSDTPQHEERFIPSEVVEWKPSFQGEGVIKITIKIDGKKYMVIELDFDRGTQKKVEDYSENF